MRLFHLPPKRIQRRRLRFVPSNPAPLVAGTASFVSSGPAGIAVTSTAPTGGAGGGPTYQWERNADGGSFGDLSGATSLSLSDTTAGAGVLYGYRLKQTRGVTTVTTNTITAQVYTGGSLTAGGGRFRRGMGGGING